MTLTSTPIQDPTTLGKLVGQPLLDQDKQGFILQLPIQCFKDGANTLE